MSAAGTKTLPLNAEIGVDVVSKDRVQETLDGLAKNPPIPVDLARITRVFSTKLQFAEFTVKGAKFSKRELKVSNDYMNADIQGELKRIVVKGDDVGRPSCKGVHRPRRMTCASALTVF